MLHPICPASDIPPGRSKILRVGRIELGVFNVAGEYFAYRNVCPHAGAPVCAGPVTGTSLPSGVYEYNYGAEGTILRCPWHGWEFDLRTGEHLVDPETRLKKIPVGVSGCDQEGGENLERFPVERDGDHLYVTLPG